MKFREDRMSKLIGGRFSCMRLIMALAGVSLLFLTTSLFHSFTSYKVPVARIQSAIDETSSTTKATIEEWTGPVSEITLDEDILAGFINEPVPRCNFSLYKDYPPANMEHFVKDRRVFATLFCSRRSDDRDPYLAAVQQMIWRVLWSDFASIYPIVVFVCPFIDQKYRDLFKAQGAWVEELPLIDVKVPRVGFARWADQFAKLNLWNFTQFERIAYLDTDAFPIANPDGIFAVALVQECKYEKMDEQDRGLHAVNGSDSRDYVFAGVAEHNGLMEGGRTGTNGGLLVIRPDEWMHRRLVRNANRTEEYDQGFMEQSLLSSSLGFGVDSAFPAQEVSPIYNFGGPNLGRLVSATDVQEPLMVNYTAGTPAETKIPANTIVVLHDKIWLGVNAANNNAKAPEWNQMWSIDWMRMCRTYDDSQWPRIRKLGRVPHYFERLKWLAEDAAADKKNT